MTHYLTIFAFGFASVFLLGFQSRLVNHGNFAWAAVFSFSIAMSQGLLWSRMMSPTAGWLDFMVYGLSGSMAITSAMWIHRRFFMKPA